MHPSTLARHALILQVVVSLMAGTHGHWPHQLCNIIDLRLQESQAQCIALPLCRYCQSRYPLSVSAVRQCRVCCYQCSGLYFSIIFIFTLETLPGPRASFPYEQLFTCSLQIKISTYCAYTQIQQETGGFEKCVCVQNLLTSLLLALDTKVWSYLP